MQVWGQQNLDGQKRQSDQSRFDNVECNNCKGLGHFQRSCNWNGDRPLKSKETYQLCNQQIHIAQSCIKLESFSQGNQMSPGTGTVVRGENHDQCRFL